MVAFSPEFTLPSDAEEGLYKVLARALEVAELTSFAVIPLEVPWYVTMGPRIAAVLYVKR